MKLSVVYKKRFLNVSTVITVIYIQGSNIIRYFSNSDKKQFIICTFEEPIRVYLENIPMSQVTAPS